MCDYKPPECIKLKFLSHDASKNTDTYYEFYPNEWINDTSKGFKDASPQAQYYKDIEDLLGSEKESVKRNGYIPINQMTEYTSVQACINRCTKEDSCKAFRVQNKHCVIYTSDTIYGRRVKSIDESKIKKWNEIKEIFLKDNRVPGPHEGTDEWAKFNSLSVLKCSTGYCRTGPATTLTKAFFQTESARCTESLLSGKFYIYDENADYRNDDPWWHAKEIKGVQKTKDPRIVLVTFKDPIKRESTEQGMGPFFEKDKKYELFSETFTLKKPEKKITCDSENGPRLGLCGASPKCTAGPCETVKLEYCRTGFRECCPVKCNRIPKKHHNVCMDMQKRVDGRTWMKLERKPELYGWRKRIDGPFGQGYCESDGCQKRVTKVQEYISKAHNESPVFVHATIEIEPKDSNDDITLPDLKEIHFMEAGGYFWQPVQKKTSTSTPTTTTTSTPITTTTVPSGGGETNQETKEETNTEGDSNSIILFIIAFLLLLLISFS